MSYAGQHGAGERAGAGIGALIVQALMASVFLWGLGVDVRGAVERPMQLINVLPPPLPEREPVVTRPPPPVPSEEQTNRLAPREEGGSSAPNIRSQATEIVAPVRPPILPPPVISAPIRGVGRDPSTGAADIRGPGTGSGGYGTGSGSGYGGGGGGGGGPDRPPRQIRGRLRYSDIPQEVVENEAGGERTVGVIFTILANGRVVDCRITRPSGSRLLDYRTCELIEQRFVYDPSRDWRGRPIESRMTENHSWLIEDLPPEPREYRRRRRF